MSLFQELETMLNTSESLTFNIIKAKTGELEILITPKLTAEPDNASDEVKRARGALALPLRIKATATELDHGLVDSLKEVNVQRSDIAESMSALMDTLKETKKETKVASQGQSSKAGKAKGDEINLDESKTEVAGTVAKPASVTTAQNPSSL